MYTIQKNLTRLDNLGYTYFLDPNELNKLTAKLKKNEYKVYKPYLDSEKNIVYKKNIPDVYLYEIISKIEIKHQDILGTMYSLNIASDLFGDILVIDNHYYIYLLPIVRNYFEANLTKIKNAYIELKEIDINTLSDYQRNYERIELIVSSVRIDSIISNLIKTPRSSINSLIAKKEVLLNYDFLKNSDYKLKEGDIFSIHKYGKYRFKGIIKNTKSGNFIVEIEKYI